MHKDDKQWVMDTIRSLPVEYMQMAHDGYKKVFRETYDLEEVDYKKSNAARKAANTRLLNFKRKVLSI
jgi:hypothetical protein